MLISGAEAVVRVLIEQGCDTVFGYPGGQVTDLYDALWRRRRRIRHILTAGEQGAAHAADGYARASGKTGVVMATSGPGATNLVTGIATAYLDSVPMVAVTGNVPCGQIGRDSFQEVDILGVTMPVTKHNFIVKHAEELPDTLRTAFRIAQSGRKGPVLVDIPKDVQTAKCHFTPQKDPVKPDPPRIADADGLAEAAEMLAAAARPYIYFGGGIVSGGASDALTALADRLDAPMGCSLMGLSAVPHDHPRFLGMTGMHGSASAAAAENEADLVLALGVRFSDRATGEQHRFAPNAAIIHIDIDNAELQKNIPAALALCGDLKDALNRLLDLLPQQKHPAWNRHISALRHKEKACPVPQSRTPGMLHPYRIIDAVQPYAKDAVIVTDVGQHQMWTAQRYPFREPRTFLTSGGLGTMGFGLGAAIGAYLATGKRPILFTGDGSFIMNLNELSTAVGHRVPAVIVLMRNGTLGMVRQWQKLFFGERYAATDLSPRTDFIGISAGFGGLGMRVEKPEDLPSAVEAAFSSDLPFVIECPVSPDELVLPMRTPDGGAGSIITEYP